MSTTPEVTQAAATQPDALTHITDRILDGIAEASKSVGPVVPKAWNGIVAVTQAEGIAYLLVGFALILISVAFTIWVVRPFWVWSASQWEAYNKNRNGNDGTAMVSTISTGASIAVAVVLFTIGASKAFNPDNYIKTFAPEGYVVKSLVMAAVGADDK